MDKKLKIIFATIYILCIIIILVQIIPVIFIVQINKKYDDIVTQYELNVNRINNIKENSFEENEKVGLELEQYRKTVNLPGTTHEDMLALKDLSIIEYVELTQRVNIDGYTAYAVKLKSEKTDKIVQVKD